MSWQKDLTQFKREMAEKLKKNIPEKGTPARGNCQNFDERYMLKKAFEHAEVGNYSDAANYLFMLWNGQVARRKAVQFIVKEQGKE